MKMNDPDKSLIPKNRSHPKVLHTAESGINNIEVLKVAINTLMEKTEHLESEVSKLVQLIHLYSEEEPF
jgi:hypothetical protein